MSVFTGAGVAIITPFKSNGEVDYDAFEGIIEDQIARKTDAIVVCGTTGEASTLSHEEHIDVVKYCAQVVKGRVPVVAGTGSNSTETAIYLSQEAEKAGVDGVLLVSPYYNKATQNGLYQHFKATADSIKIPVILYNIQGRTGVNIQPATIVKLVKDVENIVAVKEASGNISQIAQILALADGNIDLYSGNDDQIVPILSLGGKGVISVLSNVMPEYTHDICETFFNGDVKKSAKMQLDALPLINALFSEVNPIPVKEAMFLKGLCGPDLRLPLTRMEPAHAEVLKAEMEKMGVI
ncbi:MAG: 4-hydroxy-tetrahydrodipicolinate synthase [Lachnospiraceae bacterium]|jgi:4-hydroxy-tetrahydrodipicolinate synthase|nr:4-hydroxy-tetrahydrodipicolinate synthase [Lachnospiraceae bacterium]